LGGELFETCEFFLVSPEVLELQKTTFGEYVGQEHAPQIADNDEHKTSCTEPAVVYNASDKDDGAKEQLNGAENRTDLRAKPAVADKKNGVPPAGHNLGQNKLLATP